MPTYRSISVALHSQFDIQPYPEYLPDPQSSTEQPGSTLTPPGPVFIDEKRSTCSVYIPVYPGSQFWIRYRVLPPVPDDQLFLFKFYINGAHIVSWSTGKDDNWKGKTVFALYETNAAGRKKIEKRALCFAAAKDTQWSDTNDPLDDSARLEIRVHRALGRRRMERQVHQFEITEHDLHGRGVSLINAGHAGSEQPKRFYKHTLIDPIDCPFATFRYYYRTWGQIQDMGLSKHDKVETGDETNLPVIEPYDEFKAKKLTFLQPEHRKADGHLCGLSAHGSTVRHVPEEARDEIERSPTAHQRSSRLSVPPSHVLAPPEPSSRPLPLIPERKSGTTETSYQPHPVVTLDDWETRTPSPVRSIRATISTPTMRRRIMTPTKWLSAIADTWRRIGTSSNVNDNENHDRAASRNELHNP